jgi:uncharacterized tellurite resistance protein B-like protein
MVNEIFKDLRVNQKMSLINALSTIGLSDGQINEKESTVISNIANSFNIKITDCVEYFQYNGGHTQLSNDLTILNKAQKEIFVIIIWELIISDGKPNGDELSITYSILERIDITEDMFFEIIERKPEIMKEFNQN